MAEKITGVKISNVANGYVMNVDYFDQAKYDESMKSNADYYGGRTETHLAMKGSQLVKLVKAFIKEAEAA